MAKIIVNGAIFDLTKETLAYIRENYGENFRYKIDVSEDILQLSSLTDQYFYNEAKKRDYLNMGEILYDAQANPPDPDAVFLKKFYDAIWEKEDLLEKEIQKMSLEELLNLNLREWAYKQYEEIKRGLENG